MSFAVKLVAMATQRKKPKHLARFKNNLPQIFFGASLLFMKFILICEKTWPPAGYRFLLTAVQIPSTYLDRYCISLFSCECPRATWLSCFFILPVMSLCCTHLIILQQHVKKIDDSCRRMFSEVSDDDDLQYLFS